ncbi:MAG TPA: gamma carbonic anhydrase family protein [Bacteroidota bacterium]|nr:gamma carbonic anhydrase family protein [Bacteroidota bacterium]
MDAATSALNFMANLIAYNGISPKLHPSVHVAEGATLVGNVEIGEQSSVWFHAVVRGDVNNITIGMRTNVQDNAVLHVTETFPLRIGNGITIGHNAVLHGCTIEDGCLIGMGSLILDGAIVKRGAMVAAGAVILEGMIVPEGVLAAGVPANIKRPLTDKEKLFLIQAADNYVGYVEQYRSQ